MGVRPEGDYARTAGLVRDRTGGAEVYEPSADALVEQKVTALLADGLTVDEAVRVALLANWSFQSLFSEIGASRADVVQSQLLTNPSMGFMVRFPEGGGRSDLTLNFGQELVDLWQIPVKRRIAEAKLDQVVFNAARQGIELAADVKAGCYRVLGARSAEAIMRDNVTLIERSLKLAQDRFKAGETGLLDVNLVRSNLLQVQLDLIQTQRDRRVAETQLARLLGLTRWKTPWELKDTLPRPSDGIADDTALIVQAMRQRFETQVVARDVNAAEGELQRQWLNIVPSVTAGAELERLERRALPGRSIPADMARASIRSGALTAPDIQTRDERRFEKRQIIDAILGPSLSLTLPIYDQNQAQIAKAKFAVEQKRKEYEALLDRVTQEVQQAADIARTAAETVRFFETKSLPQGRQSLDAARRSYEAGEQGVIALIEAQEVLITLQKSYAAATRDYAIAMAELERALGGALPMPPPTSGPASESMGAASGLSEQPTPAAAPVPNP